MSPTSKTKSGVAALPTTPQWYSELPNWTKIVFQLGFATVFVAYVFITAQYDRQIFREELQAERQELRGAVVELKRALDAISHNQQMLKTVIENKKE